MSRIGKKPIEIPDKVEVNISGQKVRIKGPKGNLEYQIAPRISAVLRDKELCLSSKAKTDQAKALWGLWRALLQNAILGVTRGFKKELEIQGIGYGATIKGGTLQLKLGFSNLVKIDIPSDLQVEAKKNSVVVQGIDKQKVGQFAAQVRAVRPPDPYKGKGVRYKGEKVRRKEGKKAVTAEI